MEIFWTCRSLLPSLEMQQQRILPAAGQQHNRCLWASPPAACLSHRTSHQRRGRSTLVCRAESKEYYDYKDMPPLPMTVTRIHIPSLGYTVVDKESEPMRMASLAIFYDIHKDSQYQSRLSRKSAITALCMYDRDDVDEAQRKPGTFPNIDLLQRVYSQGLDLEIAVDEFTPK